MTASNPHSAPANVGASVHGGAETEIWESLLRSAIRAPSGHNTQPWRFQILGDRHHMSADRSRAQPVVDPEDRAMVISCGAALAHLIGALRHSGFQPIEVPALRVRLRDLLDTSDVPQLLLRKGCSRPRPTYPTAHRRRRPHRRPHEHRNVVVTGRPGRAVLGGPDPESGCRPPPRG